jgi:hypothetical protein
MKNSLTIKYPRCDGSEAESCMHEMKCELRLGGKLSFPKRGGEMLPRPWGGPSFRQKSDKNLLSRFLIEFFSELLSVCECRRTTLQQTVLKFIDFELLAKYVETRSTFSSFPLVAVDRERERNRTHIAPQISAIDFRVGFFGTPRTSGGGGRKSGQQFFASLR